MTSNDTETDIITQANYVETDLIYQKIKKDFIGKLKEKYQCDDYDSLVKYVFDLVFIKKHSKPKCIEEVNSIFNNKADVMINYLWQITKKYEKESELHESDEDNQQDSEDYRKSSHRRGGKNIRGRDIKRLRGKGKYFKNYKKERSRSASREINKYDYDGYQKFPTKQKGFYPPNGRFRGMMPMRGGYPAYYPPVYIQR